MAPFWKSASKQLARASPEMEKASGTPAAGFFVWCRPRKLLWC
jgi:hypothetical protein